MSRGPDDGAAAPESGAARTRGPVSGPVLRLAYASAAIAALVVLLAGAYIERQARASFRQDQRAEVLGELGVLRADLEGRITANIQLVQGLVGVISTEPDMDQARFSELVGSLLESRNQIRLIAAAPNLVIAMVHPQTGNAAALGLDYRRDPAQREAALKARDLDTTVLAGPVDLVQGGRGFIGRTPVLWRTPTGTRRFWGLVSTVIDETALYRASGLLDPDLGLDVVLVGRDGMGARGAPFFGDPGVLAQDPVTAKVTLPYGSWRIAAVPKGGWAPTPPGLWLLRGLVALAGALIVVPILITAHAIEARRSRDAVLRARESEFARLSRRLALALEASRVGAWDLHIASGALVWDQRMKDLYGIGDREGMCSYADWTAVIHPQDIGRTEAELQEAIDAVGPYASEYRLCLPDGTIRHIRSMGTVYEDVGGDLRIVGIEWDLTADVRRQEELEVGRLEAEAATVAKSQFLATMSHEIRTPMTGVLGMLDLILRAEPEPEQRARAETARASAKALLRILNDILDFSKLEADQLSLSAEAVDPSALLDEVEALLGPGAAEKGLALACTVTQAVPARISADPVRLRQVLTNLIGNAVKFTEAGEVAVRMDYDAPAAAGAQGRLRVEVRDSGIGIGPALRDRLFQRFVQGDGSLARRAGGTGLGLAISRQLVERMGGAIELESRPGRGSTFRFWIAARPATAPRTEPAAVVAPSRPLRVLLAEDNATNQHIVRAYLTQEGHAVETVGNGLEAVQAVRGGGFDLVLMDVQMPLMDGPAATRAIRALDGAAAAIPVVALTANAMPGDREQYLAAGMTDYVSKPIDPEALHAAVARAGARAPEREPEFEASPLPRSA